MQNLNQLALRRCRRLLERADESNIAIAVQAADSGTTVVDCGVKATGGLEAGIALAEVCLADLGRVSLAPPRESTGPWPQVSVAVDRAVDACLASQYAGWNISQGDYFAMGSGPMRAAAGSEAIFNEIGRKESPREAIGVLESGKLPPDEVCRYIADACRVSPENLMLLVARTASLAGCIQVVARTVETALHKLHELQFDVQRVESGFGTAPLPPVAGDDLAGIGRTNDAVLYGGEVTLWVRGDDASLAEIGPRVPSSSSADYGRPFAEIFERHGNNFYEIDPLLFSPASVTLMNLDSGRSHRFGDLNAKVLAESFGNSRS